MMTLEAAERLILQTILGLQGDAGNFVDDARIAEETDLDLVDVRNWLLNLEKKGLVSIVKGETGLRALVEPLGVLTLNQSLPYTLKRIEDEQSQQPDGISPAGLFQVPYARNRYFTGREGVLAALAAPLATGKATA